jgi:hypothetical protein
VIAPPRAAGSVDLPGSETRKGVVREAKGVVTIIKGGVYATLHVHFAADAHIALGKWTSSYSYSRLVNVEKRYQVFVSSTFEDLQLERQEVMQALLELDCIPAGMELFPAADEDQWTLIRKVIDHSDYYIVIIGGRYGSVGPMGLSYTEMEYRYALDKAKPVLAFVHKDPSTLIASRVESEPSRREKLRDFRCLAEQKMCRYWTTPSDLGGLVSRSMVRLMKHCPAVGWIRGDQLPVGNPVQELLEARRRLELTEARLTEVVEGSSAVGLSRAVARQSDFGTDSDWLSLLASAVERVDLMGRTLYNWTQSDETASLIRRKIVDENVRFRWLVMSPLNKFLPVLEENRVNIGDDLRLKLQAVDRFLSALIASLPESSRESLKVRFFTAVPLYFGYVRIDNRFHVTHYLCSASSFSSPMICLSDVGAIWSRAYAREFETVWQLSTDLAELPAG